MANRNKKSNGKSGGGDGRSPNEERPSAPSRLFCIRFTLFFLVVALTGVSILFGYSLNALYNQVQSDSATIQSLQGQIANQTAAIARFNMSVTNADIEQHVQQLEDELHQNENEMRQSLQQEKADIQATLDQTILNLNQTVE